MEYEIDEYYDRQDLINKSNVLIDSKYRSTLLEARLFAISLSKIESALEDEVGTLIVKIRATEIMKLIDANKGSFYTQLENTARAMTGRRAGFSDPENNRFVYMNVIKTAIYEDGMLTIKFNEDMRQYLKGLTSSYTQLSLIEMLSFTKPYSFRLFEIIKSRCFTPKGMAKVTHWKLPFNISELKLMIGVVNSELDAVQKILNGAKTPDYDRAVEISPEHIYDSWSDFKKRVLEPSVKEINQRTNYNVFYDTIKGGKGGKVYSVIFYVDLIPPKNEKVEIDQYDFLDEVKDILPTIKSKDLLRLGKTVDYDIELIKKAADYMNNYQGSIKDPVAFILWAITNDFPKKNSFNNFMQTDYDFDEIAKLMEQ